jgi:hypothetical protein
VADAALQQKSRVVVEVGVVGVAGAALQRKQLVGVAGVAGVANLLAAPNRQRRRN